MTVFSICFIVQVILSTALATVGIF